MSGAEDTAVVNGAAVAPKVDQFIAHCTDLSAYIEGNAGALIDHGARHGNGEPISTSRAEGTVN